MLASSKQKKKKLRLFRNPFKRKAKMVDGMMNLVIERIETSTTIDSPRDVETMLSDLEDPVSFDEWRPEDSVIKDRGVSLPPNEEAKAEGEKQHEETVDNNQYLQISFVSADKEATVYTIEATESESEELELLDTKEVIEFHGKQVLIVEDENDVGAVETQLSTLPETAVDLDDDVSSTCTQATPLSTDGEESVASVHSASDLTALIEAEISTPTRVNRTSAPAVRTSADIMSRGKEEEDLPVWSMDVDDDTTFQNLDNVPDESIAFETELESDLDSKEYETRQETLSPVDSILDASDGEDENASEDETESSPAPTPDQLVASVMSDERSDERSDMESLVTLATPHSLSVMGSDGTDGQSTSSADDDDDLSDPGVVSEVGEMMSEIKASGGKVVMEWLDMR